MDLLAEVLPRLGALSLQGEMMKRKPTQEQVIDLLDYDRETGVFRWKKKRPGPRNTNCEAGSRYASGYVHICLFGQIHKAHRLAWLICYGDWPESEIDHINGVRDDNRIANLRLASKTENMQNVFAAKKSNKTSGLLGAYWHKKSGKWAASIRANSKRLSLGLFDSAEAAHAAYMKAKAELHPFASVTAI